MILVFGQVHQFVLWNQTNVNSSDTEWNCRGERGKDVEDHLIVHDIDSVDLSQVALQSFAEGLIDNWSGMFCNNTVAAVYWTKQHMVSAELYEICYSSRVSDDRWRLLEETWPAPGWRQVRSLQFKTRLWSTWPGENTLMDSSTWYRSTLACWSASVRLTSCWPYSLCWSFC